MGYQLADLQTFAAYVATAEGVSGVWLIPDAGERTCTMLVAVRGFDEEAQQLRMDLRQEIEQYLANHADEMRYSHFVVDYRLTVDEPNLGPVPVPSGAQQVAVAS